MDTLKNNRTNGVSALKGDGSSSEYILSKSPPQESIKRFVSAKKSVKEYHYKANN